MKLSPFLRGSTLVAAIALAACARYSENGARLIIDRASYNGGSEVLVRLTGFGAKASDGSTQSDLTAVIRYAGESQPVARVPLPSSTQAGYFRLWQVPETANTGRYEIAIEFAHGESSQSVQPAVQPASFTVYRKLVQIEEIHLGKTVYTSGDPVAVSTKIRNLTGQPLTGLRVEFSDRYWPWIAGPAAQAKASVVPLATEVNLAPGAEMAFESSRAGVTQQVAKPAVHQYGVVVWDHERQAVLAIGFSSLTVIHPPGSDEPHVYPSQYMYPQLDQVSVAAYRHFYSPDLSPLLNSASIEFDHARTLFPTGRQAEVKFRLGNSSAIAWHDVSVHARLLRPKGSATGEQAVAESIDLAPGKPALLKTVSFELPADAGLYKAEVEVRDGSGGILAANRLELGVNPLPKSILVFCAHEDDEGGWMGPIRAAVENRIPIRFVYFTSGDAGSCDLYFQQSCNPEQAAQFGSIRMDEVRAALGHLGVPYNDIYFLGLPDGASGMIWYDHLAPSNPFLDPLLGVDHAPYDELVHPNLAYDRESVVEAVEQLILRCRPEVIITAHPKAEGHIDHVVNNYFVVKALQSLRSRNVVPPDLKLWVDRVYEPKEMPPTPYRYADHTFYLSGEAEALAQEAGWYHQSQGGNRAIGHLKDFDELARSLPYREILDWSEHAGWNEKRNGSSTQRIEPTHDR